MILNLFVIWDLFSSQRFEFRIHYVIPAKAGIQFQIILRIRDLVLVILGSIL